MLARCWCNGDSCSSGVNGGWRSSLRTSSSGSCCMGSRCEILPGKRRTVNRGLRRLLWKPLQRQLHTDVSSSSDTVSPWLPTWPNSIEPFAIITSPSRRTAPCAACVTTIFSFILLYSLRCIRVLDGVFAMYQSFLVNFRRLVGRGVGVAVAEGGCGTGTFLLYRFDSGC